jgi:hypothetical protein
MSHNIALHDIVTFTLDKTTEEAEDEEVCEDDEDEEGFEEDDEEQAAEYVFNMKAHASNGDNKEHHYVQGICGFPYASSVCIACHLEYF